MNPLSVIFGLGSVVGIAIGYGLDGPGIESRWRRDFPPVQTGPGTHPASCTMGTGSFPEVKSGRGVTLTPHPLLVPWPWKGRAIPLLPLWAVRPVQSLSACTGVHFSFFFYICEEAFSLTKIIISTFHSPVTNKHFKHNLHLCLLNYEPSFSRVWPDTAKCINRNRKVGEK